MKGILALTVAAAGLGAEPAAPIHGTMESQVLRETREYIIHLPASYGAGEKRYPVLYVLDGTSQDGHTAATAAKMALAGEMPELIVVGLPNVRGGRPRDYTPPFIRQDTEKADSPMGEADRFLVFLKTELIPLVEQKFRTAAPRMIAGHSRGGLFVAYSLFADPGLFQARFAHSPALHREETVMAKKFAAFFRDGSPGLPPNSFFYMSLGTAENAPMAAAFASVSGTFRAHAPASLRWRAERTPGAVHANNAQLATPSAFQAFAATLTGR